MVSRHTLTAKNTSSVQAGNTKEVTTQMMQSGDHPQPQPFKNHSNILVWTDKDNHDLFSLHLQRRLSYLKNTCPALNECNFTFEKKDSEQADIVVIATKRHFPYGGKKSSKTWTLILPGNSIFYDFTLFENHQKCRILILAFSTNFCTIKIDQYGNNPV